MNPPGVGEIAEGLTFDCKALYPNLQAPGTLAEIAKDIAAFANSAGGSIFVGISEDRSTRRVAGYSHLTSESIKEHTDAIEKAGRLLNPTPVFAITPSKVNDEHILIVTINSSGHSPVGVTVAPTQEKGLSQEPSFRFPMRVSTNTVYLSPNQLSLLMESRTRRVAAVLSGIPLTPPPTLYFVTQGRAGETHELVQVDIPSNAIVTRRIVDRARVGRAGGNADALTAPDARSLDAILSVHRNPNGHWTVVLDPRFGP